MYCPVRASSRPAGEAAKAAVKLTDEQKAKRAENHKGAEALHKEFREKLIDILTPEQKENDEDER